MSDILKRFTYIAVLLLLFFAVTSPLGLYWLGLYSVNGKPSFTTIVATQAEREEIWIKVKGKGNIEIKSINPYKYLWVIFSDRLPSPSLRLAYRIAADHNIRSLQFKGNLWWHLSGAAMTIWITNNWSTEQVFSKLVEIERSRNG